MVDFNKILQDRDRRRRGQPRTHGGAPAKQGRDSAALIGEDDTGLPRHTRALLELHRYAATCMLLENTFYESGGDIANRMAALVKECRPDDLVALIDHVRNALNVRHAAVFLAAEMCLVHKGRQSGDAVYAAVQRPDDATMLLSVLFLSNDRTGRHARLRMLPHQAQRGLQRALHRWDEYQLGKYASRKGAFSLKDVLRLARPRPKRRFAKEVHRFDKLFNDTLPIPNTWETRLSSGEDKRAVWEDLLRTNALGGLALLRNLRNMDQAGVDRKLVARAVAQSKFNRVLPFRFIEAAKHAPWLERELEESMLRALGTLREEVPLPGKTVLLVDVSISMNDRLSRKSDVSRREAAATMAMLFAEVCEELQVFAFHNDVTELPTRKGIGMVDAVMNAASGATDIPKAVDKANSCRADRIVCLTDEQSTRMRRVPQPKAAVGGYMLNLAPYSKSVAFGEWMSISGFSEYLVHAIHALENTEQFLD